MARVVGDVEAALDEGVGRKAAPTATPPPSASASAIPRTTTRPAPLLRGGGSTPSLQTGGGTDAGGGAGAAGGSDPGGGITGDSLKAEHVRIAVAWGGVGDGASNSLTVGFYEEQVLPRVIDVVLGGAPYRPVRSRVATPLEGEVLEVGFGSGRNVPYYPAAVTRVRAVDPAIVGRKLAAKRVSASSVPVEYVGLDGQELPLDDAAVDHVLTTWTLCTIPDVDAALAEIRRVLRPGGALHFLEHGRSDDPKVARRQDRFTPIQRRVAGGCHVNRRIDDLVARSGLEITELERYTMPGPRVFTTMYEGVATKA